MGLGLGLDAVDFLVSGGELCAIQLGPVAVQKLCCKPVEALGWGKGQADEQGEGEGLG